MLRPLSFYTASKNLIDRLLLERISLAGISRITGVSERWLQTHVNQKYEQTPRHVQSKKRAENAWLSSAMNCGRLFKTVTINGFGWPLTEIPARLSGSISGIVAGKALKPSGRLCRPSIGNAQSVIPIFGHLMKPCFPPNAIVLRVKNPGKQIIPNASIVPSDNGFPDSSEKRYHFRKNSPIILVPFGTLSIITMQRFLLIKHRKESFGFQDYPPSESPVDVSGDDRVAASAKPGVCVGRVWFAGLLGRYVGGRQVSRANPRA